MEGEEREDTHIAPVWQQLATVEIVSAFAARGEAQAIALALDEKAEVLGIDDKNGINACKLLGVAFTTAVGILIRIREKGLLEESDALEKLASLAKHGRYKDSIMEDARLKLLDKP